MKQLSISFNASTSAGVKEENQDAWGFESPKGSALVNKGVVAVIADGVSSSAAGRDASQTSVSSFLADYYSTPDSWTVKHAAARVISALNSWLYSQGLSYRDAMHGLVTTFSCLIFKSATAHIIHIGDSRIYRIRGTEIEPLTRDHLAKMPDQKTFLSRALGADVHVELDYRREPLIPGDVYFLATDGVYEYVHPEEMMEKLATLGGDFQLLCDWVIAESLSRGSDDNLTCAFARVDSIAEENEEEVYQQLTNLPFPPDLEPGNKLDGYRILQGLHASSRSQLYLAEDSETGQYVVIKTPSVNFKDDPTYIDSFIREEWIGRRLSHPGIMQIFAPKQEKRFLYHVCEYIKGKSLSQWMQDNPKPSIDTVREVVQQVCNAVRAMHRMDVLHQDIKPDNIMIDERDRVRLIDFGSARVAGLGETQPIIDTELPAGTRDYTAPEYLLGQSGTGASDLFSIAVIAYEMMTGELPYKQQIGTSYRIKSLNHMKYRSLMTLRPDLPEWIDKTFERAVAPHVRDRYQAMSEFCFDLSRPNPAYLKKLAMQPLIEKNPVLVWQGLSALSVGVNLYLLYLLFR